MLNTAKKQLELLRELLQECKEKGISISKPQPLAYLSYQTQQREHIRQQALHQLDTVVRQLEGLKENLPESVKVEFDFLFKKFLSAPDLESTAALLGLLENLEEKELSFVLRCKLPISAQAEIAEDLEELKSAYSAGCWRSCIALCERLLGTAFQGRLLKKEVASELLNQLRVAFSQQERPTKEQVQKAIAQTIETIEKAFS